MATKFVMANTSITSTVGALPSAGVAIPDTGLSSHSCPTNVQWKRSEKSRTQTRPRNATLHVTWYLFLVMKVTRIEMSEINTKHHKRTHTSLTFRLPCLGRFITRKPTHFIPQRMHLYQPSLVKSWSLVNIQILYPATFSLWFSKPQKQTPQQCWVQAVYL